MQSTDNGATWTDLNVTLYPDVDNKRFFYAGGLEVGETYQFRVVITGGQHQGKTNDVTYHVQ